MSAEDYIDPDHYFDQDDYPSPLRYVSWTRQPVRPRAPYWTTGQGEEITLRDMEDSHIKNVLAFINRKATQWEETRTNALERNGVDIGPYVINNRPAIEWFDLLCAEIKRREACR